jgi:hypothetical protein
MLALATKAAVIAAIVFVVAFAGLAIWQRSLPSPQEPQQQRVTQEGKADEKQAEHDNDGIFDSFIAGFTRFVRLLDSHNGLVNAIGTLIVAVFTGVLFVATVALFISSEKVAKSAQKSADIAERALTGLERPYVFVQTPKFVANIIPNRPDRVQFILKNYGRTPAIVRWFKAIAMRPGQPASRWFEIFNGQVILASEKSGNLKFLGAVARNHIPETKRARVKQAKP